jgi:hypothetical protein
MRVGDRKRRLNKEDAALKLRYGEFRRCAFYGESWRKRSLPALLAAQTLAREFFPLESLCDLTGIRRANMVNIDHIRGMNGFLWKAGEFERQLSAFSR